MEDFSASGSVIPSAWAEPSAVDRCRQSVRFAPNLLHDACAGVSSVCEVNGLEQPSGDGIEVADDPVIQIVARTSMVPRYF